MSSRNKALKPATSKPSSKRNASDKTANKAKAVPEDDIVSGFFKQRMVNDICGVLVAVLAIALLFSVLAPSTALLSSMAAKGLLLAFGVGAYVVPIALLVWAISFFIRTNTGSIWRTGLGLSLITIAILSWIALYTPGAVENLDLLFVQNTLISHGGYLGAAIAWVELSLVGRLVGTVILIGIAIIGVIVIGFSISASVEKLQDRVNSSRGFDYEPQELPKARGRVSSAKKALSNVVTHGDVTTILETGDDDSKQTTQLLEQKTKKLGKKNDADVTKVLPKKQAAANGSSPKAMEGFVLPPQNLLKTAGVGHEKDKKAGQNELKEIAFHLQETLESFGLYVHVVGWVHGPTFTMFKIEMPTGVRLTRITGLQDDIALALAAESVRIFAPIPGTSLVGIEIPNKRRSSVLLGDVLKNTNGGPLMLGIGNDVEGDVIAADLASMPHLLIGGATGSGKSVAINSMLMSLLMRATPTEVRMILIDPKRVELSLYNGIPHLFVPVVTDPKEAAAALAWATIEMDRRLKVFQKAGTRNIGLYNSMVQEGRLEEDATELPYIVVVIDELSDLMMVAGKEVEGSIVRIAQLARAAGIHLIVATQRPSANVVTGLIKANIINRIAFKVSSSLDSRVILDQNGAEKLVGLGDLLFLRGDGGEPQRIQGCYVSEDEIHATVKHLKEQGEPEYHDEILRTAVTAHGSLEASAGGGEQSDDDPLLWEAAEIIVNSGIGSTSNIQRRLKVGYSRAGRIMDQLEAKGVVGPPVGSKPREVMVEDVLELESLRGLEEYDATAKKEEF